MAYLKKSYQGNTEEWRQRPEVHSTFPQLDATVTTSCFAQQQQQQQYNFTTTSTNHIEIYEAYFHIPEATRSVCCSDVTAVIQFSVLGEELLFGPRWAGFTVVSGFFLLSPQSERELHEKKYS